MDHYTLVAAVKAVLTEMTGALPPDAAMKAGYRCPECGQVCTAAAKKNRGKAGACGTCGMPLGVAGKSKWPTFRSDPRPRAGETRAEGGGWADWSPEGRVGPMYRYGPPQGSLPRRPPDYSYGFGGKAGYTPPRPRAGQSQAQRAGWGAWQSYGADEGPGYEYYRWAGPPPQGRTYTRQRNPYDLNWDAFGRFPVGRRPPITHGFGR